ncbi:MAG: single-stranded DNA-binding protein [Clostridia bacterium]|nr:single-stranded DNA-binding protein [Clostridia bacterium]
MVNENTNLQELFDIATQEISNLKPEEKFLVKDLFRGYEWNRIAKGNRTKLGSMFFAYAQGNGSKEILPLNKTPQNQQIYKKL